MVRSIMHFSFFKVRLYLYLIIYLFVTCRSHKGFTIIPIMSRINPIPRIDTYLFKVHSNIVLPSTPRPPQRSLSCRRRMRRRRIRRRPLLSVYSLSSFSLSLQRRACVDISPVLYFTMTKERLHSRPGGYALLRVIGNVRSSDIYRWQSMMEVAMLPNERIGLFAACENWIMPWSPHTQSRRKCGLILAQLLNLEVLM